MIWFSLKQDCKNKLIYQQVPVRDNRKKGLKTEQLKN